jgi:hypothetical protein
MSDRRACRDAVEMAAFYWNYIIIDSGNQPKTLGCNLVDSVKQLVEKQLCSDPLFRVMLSILSESKKSLYPDNNRMIADFNLSWDEKGETMHLTVMSPD